MYSEIILLTELFIFVKSFEWDFQFNILIFILNLFFLSFLSINTSYIKFQLKKNKIKSLIYYYHLNNFPKLKKEDKLILSYNNFNTKILFKIQNLFIPKILILYRNFGNEPIEKIECGVLKICNISDVPDLSKNIVKELILNNNNFHNVDLYKLPIKLKKLSMEYCNLRIVKIKSENLRDICMDCNNLEKVNLECDKLERLYLQHNKLIELSFYAPNLKILNLCDNNLERIELGGVCYSNLSLDISSNDLVVIPNDFLRIKNLNLRDNPIIPNLHNYRWNQYFNRYYPEFFINNIDTNHTNIYEDKESVHNPYVNHTIKNCMMELYEKFVEIDEKEMRGSYVRGIKKMSYSNRKIIRKIGDGELNISNNIFNLNQMIGTIFYLAELRGSLDLLIPIMEEQIEEGSDYCYNGKIGRIISSIMGFDLIKNKIGISRNEEIMIKYDLIKNRIIRDGIEVNSEKFGERMRKDLMNELVEIGLSNSEIKVWIAEI